MSSFLSRASFSAYWKPSFITKYKTCQSDLRTQPWGIHPGWSLLLKILNNPYKKIYLKTLTTKTFSGKKFGGKTFGQFFEFCRKNFRTTETEWSFGKKGSVTPYKMNTNNLKHIFVNILDMVASKWGTVNSLREGSMNLKICVSQITLKYRMKRSHSIGWNWRHQQNRITKYFGRKNFRTKKNPKVFPQKVFVVNVTFKMLKI